MSITVIYSGGTLGMTDLGAGLVPRPSLEPEVRELAVRHLPRGAGEVEYLTVDEPIDSAEAGPDTLRPLIDLLRRVHDAGGSDVVLLHGTDTMAYGGARLAFEAAHLGLRLVLTGAQIPWGAEGSDAPTNIALALDAIASDVVKTGTWIAFGGWVHPAVRATKAYVDDHCGFVSHPLVPGADPLRLHDLPDVVEEAGPAGLVSVFPGMSVELLRQALRLHPDGLVLECYGAGTAPVRRPGVLEAIDAATRAGTPVLVTTQCATGAVDLPRYAGGRALAEAGAIGGGELTREAALAKLDHLAGRGLDLPSVREWLGYNLIGEGSADRDRPTSRRDDRERRAGPAGAR